MINLNNSQLFKATKDPKIILKITLMLLFDHFMSKRYQKVPSCINLRVWTKGFCHPLQPLCTVSLPPSKRCMCLMDGAIFYLFLSDQNRSRNSFLFRQTKNRQFPVTLKFCLIDFRILR